MFRPSRLLPFLLLVGWLLAACAPATPAASPTVGVPTATSATAPSPTVAPSPTSPATPTSAPTPTPAASPTVQAAVAGFPVTVSDDDGNTLTFDRPPQRIISLSPGHTETLYALGLGDKVIMTDKYSDFPAENKSKATLVTYPKPNVEQLIALQPDLIVTLVEGGEFTQQMNAHGVKVLKLFPKTFDGTLKDIEILGRATGTEARARAITTAMRERANAVIAKTRNAPRPSVLYELDASDPTKPFVAGPGGFYGNLIPLAGGKNVFDDLKGSAGQVSAEQIIARNPSIIILGDAHVPYNPQTPAMVKARHGWDQIDAVRSDRIYVMDDALLSRPGPRLIDGLEQLAKLIHPELFR